jgi:hypothetical protein
MMRRRRRRTSKKRSDLGLHEMANHQNHGNYYRDDSCECFIQATVSAHPYHQ